MGLPQWFQAALWVLFFLTNCKPYRDPTRPYPSDAMLKAQFTKQEAIFTHLRDRILADKTFDWVRVDAYTWVDPCNTPACGKVPRRQGVPPGEKAQACDWEHGCERWRDGRPTPEDLAAIGGISVARASDYLEDLDALGAIGVVRESDGQVVFLMHLSGIIPSGCTKAVVWAPDLKHALVSDTDVRGGPHGDNWAALAPGWYIEKEWN